MHLVTNVGPAGSLLSAIVPLLTSAESVDWVAGYASYDGVSEIMAQSPGRLRVLVGMPMEDGLSLSQMRSLRWASDQMERLGGGIRIAGLPCHSKFLVGVSGAASWTAIGSSNLSRAGLYERNEANIVDSIGALTPLLKMEFDRLWANSRPLEESPIKLEREPQSSIAPARAQAAPRDEIGEEFAVDISLLGNSGEVHLGDGLNWWRDPRTGAVRTGRPNGDCIPIRATNSAAIGALLGSVKTQTRFKALTHTGDVLELMLQGDGAAGGAKQICTAGNLGAFGEWALRRVLQLPVGETVTKKILLKKLNRTDIRLVRLSRASWDGAPSYFLDFSKRQN